MSEDDLGARASEVLAAVIHEHVITGEPVASERVARRSGLGLSPATIRSAMAELEEQGLLRQPHTSAGRVPTDQAYRVYVNRMLRRPQRLGASQVQAIESALADRGTQIPDLLGEASRQLSTFSNQVGLVLAPEMKRIIVDRIEFVRLGPQRLMAILVGRSGVVHNRVLDIAEPIETRELERIGRYLSEEFGGRTLPRMRALLRKRMGEERAAYDRLVRRSLELGSQAADAADQAGEVFVEGAANLFGSPEVADLDVIRSLLKTLDEKETLIDLLTRLLEGDGVRVVIGAENSLVDLEGCSVVASPYAADGRVMGTVGIVGPTRMQYARVIPLVDYLARSLSRLLSDAEH